MLVRHPNFKLSTLCLALLVATSAHAESINVTDGQEYTTDIVATDASTSLIVNQNGTVNNKQTVIKGGELKFERGSTIKTGTLDVLRPKLSFFEVQKGIDLLLNLMEP